MATSGSVDYNQTRNEIIQGALRLCGVLGRGKTLSSDDTAEAEQALEMMIKHWQSKGLYWWKRTEATLFLDLSSESYSLGPNGAHCTESYVQTALAADESSGDGTIEVDSITGISDGDFIAIELDDDTLQWTTVNGSPSGSTITLSANLSGDASEDNTVFAYTTKINRPLKLLHARREGDNETPIPIISEWEYFNLPNKDASGKPNEIYYQPTLTTGTLYVWPVGDEATDRINFTFQESIEDFDAAGNNPDFPAEWLESLKYGLASRLGPEYGVKPNRQVYLDQIADIKLNELLDWDVEDGSVFITAGDPYG